MEMSKSDVLDKYSILAMKIAFDAALLPMFLEYEQESTRILRKYSKHKPEFASAFCQLAQANAKIWVLEARIRNEFKLDPANTCGKELRIEEIGNAALLIRKYNGERISAKNAIDMIAGDIPEVKIDHVSEGEFGNILPGKVFYSPNRYDLSAGTMLKLAPKQEDSIPEEGEPYAE